MVRKSSSVHHTRHAGIRARRPSVLIDADELGESTFGRTAMAHLYNRFYMVMTARSLSSTSSVSARVHVYYPNPYRSAEPVQLTRKTPSPCNKQDFCFHTGYHPCIVIGRSAYSYSSRSWLYSEPSRCSIDSSVASSSLVPRGRPAA